MIREVFSSCDRPDISLFGGNEMKRTLKPTTLLAPLPVVLVSSRGPVDRGAGEELSDNIMTAAWAGIVNSVPPMIQISIRKERATHGFISKSGEFAVNIADSSLARAVDFCGVKSIRELDKFNALGLTPLKLSALEQTSGVAECSVILACKVRRILELATHDVFIAEIVDVLADESLFDGEALDLGKISPLSYFHGNYYETGQKIGFFGFSVAAKDLLRRRLPGKKIK
jgi:flavin reductase (DIM6/NTAB) family NADH-FMN oxidoreductase RutF